jgi:hypothetical protein
MATLLKVLINLADIKSARGVALRVGIQGSQATPATIFFRDERELPITRETPDNEDAMLAAPKLELNGSGKCWRDDEAAADDVGRSSGDFASLG